MPPPPKPSASGRALGAVGILLSLALIALGIRAFPLDEVASAIADADAVWLLLAALFYVTSFPLRGLRWATLLAPVKKIGATTAAEVFLIGTLANNVLPARLGDVARAFVLAKRERVSASSTFATILLERVFDGLAVVGLLLVVLIVAPPSAPWVGGVAALMGLIFLGAALGSAFLLWQRSRARAILERLLRPLPAALAAKILGFAAKLARGLAALRSARATAFVVGSSIAIWLIEAGVYVIAQRALGLDVPFHGLVVVMAVLALGLTAPSAPAFVGVFEGLVVAAVGLYGVEGAPALAFALSMHAVHFGAGTLLGALASWRMGLRVRDLGQVQARDESLGAEASLQ